MQRCARCAGNLFVERLPREHDLVCLQCGDRCIKTAGSPRRKAMVTHARALLGQRPPKPGDFRTEAPAGS